MNTKHYLQITAGLRQFVSAKSAGVVLAISGLALGQAAVAQTQLEEIVVTATRVEQSIQDVPISMSVMGETQLGDRKIGGLSDILKFTPGAQGFGSGGDNARFQEIRIRGVSSQPDGSSASSSLAVMLDEMVLTSTWQNPTVSYDMNRVEVLRGPQGTSFGRNSTAGVVHMISNRPSMDEKFTKLSVDIGNYAKKSYELTHNTQLNDSTAFRLSGFYRSRDGYFEDENTGDPLDDSHATSIRAQLLIQASDELEIILRAQSTDEKGNFWFTGESAYRDGRTGNVLNVYFPGWAVPVNRDPNPPEIGRWVADRDNDWRTHSIYGGNENNYFKRDVHHATVEARYSIDDLTLTSVSSYMVGDNYNKGMAWATDIRGYFFTEENSAKVFQTELRLDNSAQDNDLQWILGGMYLSQNSRFWEEKDLFADSPYNATFHDFTNRAEIRSYGVFGNLTYTMPTNTVVSAGVRYSYDDKKFVVPWATCGDTPNPEGDPNLIGFSLTNLCFAFGGSDYRTGTTLLTGAGSDSWGDTSYRVSVTQDFSDLTGVDFNIYGSYATAFTSGTFTSEPTVQSDDNVQPTSPEFVEAYELGIKGTFLDNTFRTNLAVFYQDWTDRQQVVIDPVTAQHSTVNLAKVKTSGLEAQIDWQATDQLAFLAQGSYTKAEEDGTGEQLQGVMKNTGALAVIYNLPLSNGTDLRFYTDAVYYGKRTTSVLADAPSMTLVSGNIGWTNADGNLTLSFWGQNLTDNYNIQSRGGRPLGLAPDVEYLSFGAPRTFGLKVSYRWDEI